MKTCLHFTFFDYKAECPLVLLHGFMGSAASFETLAGYLPDVCRPIGIDLPGHGKSLFSGSACLDTLQSFEDVALMILKDLEDAGIDRFSLYGYSMGGRVAQQVAFAAPERVRHLILESAAFGIADPEMRKIRYADDCRLLENIRGEADFEAFLDKWHDMALFRMLSAELKKRLKSSKRMNKPLELARAMPLLSVGNQPYLLPELANADFPILLLYGQKDDKYMAIAANAAKNLPNARFCLIPDAFHDIHVQYPADVARVITDFIK